MVLVFDVSSDKAMFRKSYTTTSAVSFPFPPPTAVAGLMGAIVGVNHGSDASASSASFWKEMNGLRVAIGIRKPIEWFTTAVNLMKFKSPNATMGEHIQVKHQFVKDPTYRIYVQGDTDLYRTLLDRLEKGEFTYTPYLGLAYCIADLNFVGEFSPRPVGKNEDGIAVDTILPSYGDVEIDAIKSRGVHREVVPFKMNEERRLLQTVTVFYPEINDIHPSRLFVSKAGEVEIDEVGKEKVAWFDKW